VYVILSVKGTSEPYHLIYIPTMCC